MWAQATPRSLIYQVGLERVWNKFQLRVRSGMGPLKLLHHGHSNYQHVYHLMSFKSTNRGWEVPKLTYTLSDQVSRSKYPWSRIGSIYPSSPNTKLDTRHRCVLYSALKLTPPNSWSSKILPHAILDCCYINNQNNGDDRASLKFCWITAIYPSRYKCQPHIIAKSST